ncbi:hypothetical protein ACIPVK_09275 [Paeniglutamicibacter sp. MACA_103]|uniref:MFS transporter small subunit n=1 Tax=Paeniglutamicibacter sp. MACA_103 TaxID=3377337 RepID=UPI003894DE61
MDAQRHDSGDAMDVPVNPAVGRLVFGWLLVGVPLAYGVITTLSRVGQLFQ